MIFALHTFFKKILHALQYVPECSLSVIEIAVFQETIYNLCS